MFSKKYYIGIICNRDLDIFEEILAFLRNHYNIKIVNLISQKTNKKKVFNIKYFCKKIKKYPLSLIILKLYSADSNQIIYKALNTYASDIPLLNSVDSVRICESRKDSFKLIEENCKKINIPKAYYNFQDAYNACLNGIKLIIKFDVHNAPNLSKEDRIIGISNSLEELINLTEGLEQDKLFFQEYLGDFNIIHKAYVINRNVICITSHGRLMEGALTSSEQFHIRVSIDNELKRKFLRIGKKFKMSVYGIDFILTDDNKPFIIDINDFPSFRYISEGITLISDYIYDLIVMRHKLIGKIPLSIKVKS